MVNWNVFSSDQVKLSGSIEMLKGFAGIKEERSCSCAHWTLDGIRHLMSEVMVSPVRMLLECSVS